MSWVKISLNNILLFARKSFTWKKIKCKLAIYKPKNKLIKKSTFMNFKKNNLKNLCFGFLLMAPVLSFSQGIEGGDIRSKATLIKRPLAYDSPNGKKIEGADSKRSEKGEALWTVY